MKTAVEWLENEFFTKNGMQVTKESNPALFEVVEQAKAMEKEQMGYCEEEVLEVFEHFKMDLPFHYEFLVKEHLQQFKQQEQ